MKPALIVLLISMLCDAPSPSLRAQMPGGPDAQADRPPTSSGQPEDSQKPGAQQMYEEIRYAHASIRGASLIVNPGKFVSNDPAFNEKFSADKIADFGEIELSKANFEVHERSSDSQSKPTKWLVEFDIERVEHVARQESKTSGTTASKIIGILGGQSESAQTGGALAESAETASTRGTWVVGIRYKIVDTATQEQIAQNYMEEKAEVTDESSSFAGFSSSKSTELSLDSLVQRLVQKCVREIDANHKPKPV